eukprot:scaffold1885_cov402-Prasinococcus_capsulatus_cf.AAC.1
MGPGCDMSHAPPPLHRRVAPSQPREAPASAPPTTPPTPQLTHSLRCGLAGGAGPAAGPSPTGGAPPVVPCVIALCRLSHSRSYYWRVAPPHLPRASSCQEVRATAFLPVHTYVRAAVAACTIRSYPLVLPCALQRSLSS